MTRVVRQAIRLAPRLLWRSLFQPTKLYRSIYQGKRTQYIYTWAFFFGGLLFGAALGFFYYQYNQDLSYSFIFAGTVGVSMATAFAVAAAFGFAFAFAVAVASASALAGPVESPGAGIFIFAVAFAGAGAAAAPFAGFFVIAGLASIIAVLVGAAAAAVAGGASVTGAFTGAALVEGTFMPSLLLVALTALGAFLLTPTATIILLGISILCWFIIFLYGKDIIKMKDEAGTFIFLTAWFLMIFSGGGGIHILRSYEMILYPLAFLVGYLFSSIFDFVDKSQEFKKHFSQPGIYDWDVGITHYKFMKTQMLCLLWSPLMALLIAAPVYFDLVPKLDTKLLIAAAGFAAAPVFILHLPSYVTSLPLWARQRKKILSLDAEPKKMLKKYKRSVLNRLEMCYFQWPGLYKIITAFSKNKDIAMPGAIKQVHHLFWFTFQFKQAEKAVLQLAEDNEHGHEMMLALLEQKNLPLLALAATKNPLAECYLMLLDEQKQQWLSKSLGTLSFNRHRLNEIFGILEKNDLGGLGERIEAACRRMDELGDLPFNRLVAQSLQLPLEIIKFQTIEEFIEAPLDYSIFNNSRLPHTPNGVFYFTFIHKTAQELETMQKALSKLEDAAIFKNQRRILEEQKKRLLDLKEKNDKKLVEPFYSIWMTVNSHLDELMKENIRELSESAFLAIDVITPELTVDQEEQELKIEIRNSSHELATEIILELENQSPIFNITGERKKRLALLEPVSRKQIVFSTSAIETGKTTLEGMLEFSDRVRQKKRMHFSIPISIRPQPGKFKLIENPYMVGQPLKSASPLFYGREEEIQNLDRFISEFGGDRLVVCHGLRRSGKSSLLFRIHEYGFTDKNLVPVYVDMQGIDDETDFYDTLFTSIKENVALFYEKDVGNFNQFKHFFRDVKPQLGKRRIVLMIDEYEELENRVKEQRLPKSVFSHIRHLMKNEEQLFFLFCGAAKLDKLDPLFWSPFCDIAVYVKVGCLDREAAVLLVNEPVAPVLSYNKDAVEEILRQTAGQPYQLQLICRTLVEFLNEIKEGNSITLEHVEEIAGRLSTLGEDVYSRHIWQHAAEIEQLVLSAGARALTEAQNEPVDPEDIIERVQLFTEKYDPKTVFETLEHLTEMDILATSGNRYYFPSQLTCNWIASHYPLGK